MEHYKGNEPSLSLLIVLSGLQKKVIATAEKLTCIPCVLLYVLMACLVCAGCESAALLGWYVVSIPEELERKLEKKIDREMDSIPEKEWSRGYYGKRKCNGNFVDICWEVISADANPDWDTYQKIVSRLRKQPLQTNLTSSERIYGGIRRSLQNKPLTKKQHAAVLADAAHFIQSPKAGDGVSAAMLLSALAQGMLPARLYLSSPDERRRASEVAALLIPAYERARAELLATRSTFLWHDIEVCIYAELWPGSAYEFAAFVEQNPVEKERLSAKAFAVYARRAGRSDRGYSPFIAGMGGSRVAATDEQRLEVTRRMTATMSRNLRETSNTDLLYDNDMRSLEWLSTLASELSWDSLFFYDAVWPSSEKQATFYRNHNQSKRARQTPLNLIILEIWENCESAEARRAVVDVLLGLYAEAPAKTSKGAIAALMLELYIRSGDGHWLSAAPDYLRAGGDPLPADEWKDLAEQARQQRAGYLTQLDDPNLCRDADGLVIRLRGFTDLITDPQKCAEAREFITRYPMVSEKRPAYLGAEYGSERYVWERMSSARPAKP